MDKRKTTCKCVETDRQMKKRIDKLISNQKLMERVLIMHLKKFKKRDSLTSRFSNNAHNSKVCNSYDYVFF